MNTIYKLVRNATTGKCVVASELAKGRTKKSRGLRLASSIALALAFGSPMAVSAAESCTASDGQLGMVDEDGQCVSKKSRSSNGLITPDYAAGGGSASGTDSIVIGTGATDFISGGSAVNGAIVLGAGATAAYGVGLSAQDAVAIGTNAYTWGTGAIAIGGGAESGNSYSIAIGDGASASVGSVALGQNSVANVANTVSVGAVGSERQIVNVAAGAISSSSTDVVNGSQLYGVSDSVAAALGGGSVVNADGTISAPTYVLTNGGTSTNIGDALAGLDTSLSGAKSDIAGNASDIADLKSEVGNGLVQQASPTDNLTVGASTGGTAVDFTGTGGARVLTGVANGVNDSDAVTIAQLKATGLIDYTGKELGALVYDDLTLATATLGGVNGTLLTNLAPGQIASGSMDAINGGQIADLRDQLQGQIGSLDGRVGAIEDGIADGSIGGGGGSGVGNDAGGAPITNVGAGVAPTDAANLGQVNSLVQESLQAANAYTDNRVNALSDSLDNFKNDTNQRFQRLDNRLDRIGAMGAANTQMAINAAGVTNGRGRVAVGVGVQNSKAAMAVGYANTLGERTRMSIGGAFSGSETSVGIGFGVDL